VDASTSTTPKKTTYTSDCATATQYCPGGRRPPRGRWRVSECWWTNTKDNHDQNGSINHHVVDSYSVDRVLAVGWRDIDAATPGRLAMGRATRIVFPDMRKATMSGMLEEPAVTTWRELIKHELEEYKGEQIVAVAPNEAVLDVQFDDDYGSPEGPCFTAWTQNRVLFPVCYDGAGFVASVPRNPTDEETRHVGGY
jgi:hypothetical protein